MIGRLVPTGSSHGTGSCTLGLHSASLSASRAHTADPAMLACIFPPLPAASPLATPTASSSSPAVACASARTPCFISSPSSSLPLYSPYSPYPTYSSYSSSSSSSSSFPPTCASFTSPLLHPRPAPSGRASAASISTPRSASGAVSLSGQLSASSNSSSTGSLNGSSLSGSLSSSLHGSVSGSGSWSRHSREAARGARRGSGDVGDRRRGLPATAASATALISADGGGGGGGGGGEGAGGRLKGGAAAAAVGGNGIGVSWAWRGGGGEMSGEGAEARGGAADGGVVGLLQQLPLRRFLVWALVAGLVIQLRDFGLHVKERAGGAGLLAGMRRVWAGLIMMGTYVLSVVANAAVEGAQRVLPAKRRLLVALLYAFALAALLALGFAYLPPLYNTATQLILNIQGEDAYSWIATRMRAEFGDTFTEQLERYMLLMMSPPTTQGIMGAGGVAMAAHPSAALRQVFKKYAGSMLSLLATAFAATGRFLLKSLVSLILSAMIVWDLPSLARGMQSLQTSRFAPIYDELAPVVLTFGRIFCRALEAQSLIAVVNTALTFLGMMLLNIHGILVLSAVVFVFSFVPVAGVVISTVPMGLVALSDPTAPDVAFHLPHCLKFCQQLFLLIHACLYVSLHVSLLSSTPRHPIAQSFTAHPASLLSSLRFSMFPSSLCLPLSLLISLPPSVPSAHLKLHPILTLAVLLVAEHAMGVWGLLVAVPLTVFIVKHIIHTNPLASLDGPSEPTSLSSSSPSLPPASAAAKSLPQLEGTAEADDTDSPHHHPET
ncbi:unnamed protein product [Closterium sp. Naga37s-1]|nr:unnamed protein product [Closterium sp. Naga37s-1]